MEGVVETNPPNVPPPREGAPDILGNEPRPIAEEEISLRNEESTLRLRLDLAYDGTFFRGWAAQPGLRTCQGELESAVATIARHPISVTVAGRTDAGVHAAHQVVHLDFPKVAWDRLLRHPQPAPDDLAAGALVRRINALLARQYAQWMRQRDLAVPQGSSDIVVHSASAVTHDFDARFSALSRTYIYRVGAGTPQPTRRHDVVWVGNTLDVQAMNEAARPLLGEHDFLSFCKPRQGATTIRTLTRLDAEVNSEGIIEFHVAADAFCHSMVRSLVGALLDVGRGGDVHEPARLLDACTRHTAAPIAPAHGLTLEGVAYPHEEMWAQQAKSARRRRDEKPCCSEED